MTGLKAAPCSSGIKKVVASDWPAVFTLRMICPEKGVNSEGGRS